MKQELELEQDNTYIEEWINVSTDTISTVYVIGSGNDRYGVIKRVNAQQFKIELFKDYTMDAPHKLYDISMLHRFTEVPCDNIMLSEVIQ